MYFPLVFLIKVDEMTLLINSEIGMVIDKRISLRKGFDKNPQLQKVNEINPIKDSLLLTLNSCSSSLPQNALNNP